MENVNGTSLEKEALSSRDHGLGEGICYRPLLLGHAGTHVYKQPRRHAGFVPHAFTFGHVFCQDEALCTAIPAVPRLTSRCAQEFRASEATPESFLDPQIKNLPDKDLNLEPSG